MGTDDQNPSRDKLLHESLEDVPLQRFIKVGEYKIAAEYEMESNVLFNKFNVLSEGFLNRAEFFRTGEGRLEQFFRKVPEAA